MSAPILLHVKGADFIMPKLKKRTDGRYTITINGKRKYFYGRTRTETQEKCDAYKKQSNNVANFNANITIAEWAREWLRIKEPTIPPVTINSYKHIINNHILPLMGNVKLCELTVMMVR